MENMYMRSEQTTGLSASTVVILLVSVLVGALLRKPKLDYS